MATAPQFFEELASVQEIVSSTTDPLEALKKLADPLKDPAVRREFFKNLRDPRWIKPLKDAGYFKKPTNIEVTSSGGTRFSRWPESDYLLRMAKEAPEDVAGIFAGVQTDN